MDFIKTVTDAFQSLAQNFNDRIKSPIGGAFFFSWLVFNWQFVYYFIAQVDTAENKIKHITYSFIDVYNLLVYPAAAAVVYILFFPVISNVSTLVWTVIDKWLKTQNAKIIEKKVPISKEEQEVLYGLMHDQNKKHKEEKDKLQDQINALNAVFKSVEPETVDEKNRDGILAEQPSEPENLAQEEAEKKFKEKAKLLDEIVERDYETTAGELIRKDNNSPISKAMKQKDKILAEFTNSPISKAMTQNNKILAEYTNSPISKAMTQNDKILAEYTNSPLSKAMKENEKLISEHEKLDSAEEVQEKINVNRIFSKKFEVSIPFSRDVKKERYIKGDEQLDDYYLEFYRLDISEDIFASLCEVYYDDSINELVLEQLTIPKYNSLHKGDDLVPWELNIYDDALTPEVILSSWNKDYQLAYDKSHELAEEQPLY